MWASAVPRIFRSSRNLVLSLPDLTLIPCECRGCSNIDGRRITAQERLLIGIRYASLIDAKKSCVTLDMVL